MMMDRHLAKLPTVIAELSDLIHRTRTLATLLVSRSATMYQGSHRLYMLRRGSFYGGSMCIYRKLNTLSKKYEQTVETVMNAFRGRALDVQLRELSIARHCEAQLLARESRAMEYQLSANSALSVIVARVSQRLRKVIRSMNGETRHHLRILITSVNRFGCQWWGQSARVVGCDGRLGLGCRAGM
ncbi:hypothetical protein BD410DRAFT_806974 [Rickenella mellea]|uniref:Uncharacterized protein n=1 Tax=Rickenella mellea TaxID=50990 RepID=A0A4Y7PS05_9AGAM|nr:hypothetical protein BD410DRAFT_806974 [Rickenella mellea]